MGPWAEMIPTDHHSIAFAKSSHRGFHHASCEVGSFNEVAICGMCMSELGWGPDLKPDAEAGGAGSRFGQSCSSREIVYREELPAGARVKL